MLADLKGQERIRALSRLINSILSSIIEDMEIFDLALAQAVIPAEIGAEMQGTWVNIIGKGAATRVHELITEYAKERKFIKRMETVQVKVAGRKRTHSHLLLTNDWHIIFGDEPDVAIRDKRGVLRVAIEIKGSMDKAGAQTRYGEAKKSFAKALKQYGQCETMYLASCFTKAVIDQITADAQVRKIFNLIDIIEDRGKRDEFLKEIFVHQIRIE